MEQGNYALASIILISIITILWLIGKAVWFLFFGNELYDVYLEEIKKHNDKLNQALRDE